MEKRTAVSSQSFSNFPAKGRLNKDLLAEALDQKKIDIDKIQDKRLRRFLKILKNENLTQIIVIGGAVKDIFFNESINDIDISVAFSLGAREKENASTFRREVKEELGKDTSEEFYDRILKILSKFSTDFGFSVKELLPYSKGAKEAFEGLDIDYFGPIQTQWEGNTALLRRSFYNLSTREGYYTHSGAALLKLGIDADGNLYGPTTEALEALREGKILMIGEGVNLGPNDILRMLRLKHRYGLNISSHDMEIIKRTLEDYQGRDNPLPQVVTDIAQELVRKLLNEALNKADAKEELESLGILKIVGIDNAILTSTTNGKSDTDSNLQFYQAA